MKLNTPGFWKTPLPWVMAALFVISAGWFAFLYQRGVQKDSLEMEFAKALLQAGVVSVAATLLSVLVFDQQRRSAQRKDAAVAAQNKLQFRGDVLKGTLGRIITAYSSTKRARRTMRALGIRRSSARSTIQVDRYDDCMAEINDAQLELEAIKSDVKTSKALYPSAEKLTSSLRTMEQYLGTLIEEYETVRGRLNQADTELPLSKVPRFQGFIGPSTGSEFSKKFAGPHDLARAAIRTDILELNLHGDD